MFIRFNSDTQDVIDFGWTVSGSVVCRIRSTASFRDPYAWYHIVAVLDTTNATSTDRMRLYVNGQRLTSFGVTTYPAQNTATCYVNATNIHYLGRSVEPLYRYMDGYISEVNLIDGQSLDATSFGETDPQTGVWIPKRYTGTYGTNGFRLSFANNSSTTALGYDSSGNGNNWTANNFSVTPGVNNDVFVDVPSLYGTDTGLGGEVLGNYCTWNPLNATGASTANGNLEATLTGNASLSAQIRGTLAPVSGKWYWENTVTADGNQSHWLGVIAASARADIRLDNSNALSQVVYARYDGQKVVNGTMSAYAASYTTGDIIGVALDLDLSVVTFYKNNVSQGTLSLPTSGIAYVPVFWYSTTATSGTVAANFGQRPFAYAAPTGYKALCTTNLPAPAIGQTSSNQADNHFNVVTYSGNGSTQNLTTDFAPDLVWIKNRTTNYSHMLYDTLRGPSTGSVSKVISSNATDIEGTVNDNSTYGYLSSFNANGFTVTAGSFTGSGGYTNTSGQNYVAWCWNAGGTSVTNGAGTNGATIASTYRANRAAGFSIVTYTGNGVDGATVAHGLGIAPAFIIVKSRNNTYNWGVWHKNLAKYDANHTYALGLNLTRIADATAQYAVFYPGLNNTNVFGLGNESTSNQLNSTYIAYCFAEVSGYSAFGIFSHAALADGTFVNTGFRPRFLLLKGTDNASNWIIHDAVCDPVNFVGRGINANLSGAESTSNSLYSLDFVSNGFKMRNTGLNGNFIYMAIAETPSRLALAR
jgi:hypothetical protein